MQLSKALLIASLVMYSISLSQAAPLSTAFTYQGSLSDSGIVADGDYDFEFVLFDQASGGVQIAATVVLDDIPVDEGFFSVALDFGAMPFVGDDLWLEIRVRNGDVVGGFQELLPRQALTPTPFALHAEFVPANSITELEIDTASVQARVSTSCLVGQFIRAIDASGNVACGVGIDTDTTYSTGPGLALTGTEINVDSSYLQRRVGDECGNNQYIQSISQQGSIICQPDVVGLTSVTSADIVDDAVGSAAIADNAVGSSNVADGSIGLIDINTAQVQRRIFGLCQRGTYVARVLSDGNIECRVMPIGLKVTVDSSGIVGKFTSIAIRDDGRPIVSYYHESFGRLKVYDCSDISCMFGTVRTRDNTGDAGSFTSIAIRDDGRPIISYFDVEDANLKILDCVNANCSGGTVRTLDSNGSVGAGTSVTIRDNGLPIIAYYRTTNSQLKVFSCNDVDCTTGITTVLDSGFAGRYPSIAIRNDGRPIISYFKNANGNNLHVYDCSNTTCSAGVVRILESGGVGPYTSMAIRSNGRPIISYYNFTDQSLKVYDCTNINCSGGIARTLDNFGSVGEYTSIAIRNTGGPIISYYQGSSSNLKVYDCTNSTCSQGVARNLDITGDVGEYSSIAIRDSGEPIISYYDETNSALRIYSCGDSRCEN